MGKESAVIQEAGGINSPLFKKAVKRFLEKTISIPEAGCLIWEDAPDKAGYGRLSYGGRKGKPIFAHRFAWLIAHGEIPEGKDILHKCDTPSCVNIHHLYIGTQSDNCKDMHKRRRAKGRQRGGHCIWG